MDWFSELALQRDRGDASHLALSTKSTALWNAMKLMMEASCTLYNQRYPSAPLGSFIQYDGANVNQPSVRKNAVDAQGHPAAEICRVTVTFNLPVIAATYSTARVPCAFTLGRNSDGYADILFNDKSICLDRAVEIILRPIFFPESPG